MKVLILGSGVSGNGAGNYFARHNIEYEFAKNEDLTDTGNLQNQEYLDRLFAGLSFIVKSPGIKFDNMLIKKAKERGIKTINEFEFGSKLLKGDKISITGTNGKTTTVSLIYHILQNCGKQVFVGGNIGTAVSSFCDKTDENSISVLECSSFQLQKIGHFHSHISAILNITPDHLNFHKSMKEYIRAKQNITKNQTAKDFLLLNADDDILMENIPKTKAKIFYFSTKKRVIGCFVRGKSIYFNDGLNENKLVSLKNIKLVGEHNVSNILCAVLACFLETRNIDLLKNVSSFQGVSHRIEYVTTIAGVAYYNDSKATNIDSTLVALKSFKCKINLLLGGSNKGYDFDELFAKMSKNVANIVAFGQTSTKILESAKKFNKKNISKEITMKDGVLYLKRKAKKGEIILLSPACASFDQFENFEQRGNIFKKTVKELSENEIIDSKIKQTE